MVKLSGWEYMNNTILSLILSLAAGTLGMGAGGIIGGVFGRKGGRNISLVLTFAAGIMAGVVFFELVPEAVELSETPLFDYSGVVFALIALIAGVFGILLIDKIVDSILSKTRGRGHIHIHAEHDDHDHSGHEETCDCGHSHGETAEAPLGGEAGECSECGRMNSLMRTGILMLLALTLHNIPEGMAIGSSGVVSAFTAILLAVVAAIHNVPAGMAVSAALTGGGMKRWAAALLAAAAGATTALGAVIGAYIGAVSEIASGISIGVAAGGLLFVIFVEIIPGAVKENGGKFPAIPLLSGLIASAAIVFFVH